MVDTVDFGQTRNAPDISQFSSKDFLSRQQLFKKENSNPKTMTINFTEVGEQDVVVQDKSSPEKGLELGLNSKNKTIEHLASLD